MSGYIKSRCDNSIITEEWKRVLRLEVFEETEVALTYVRCTPSCLYRSRYLQEND